MKIRALKAWSKEWLRESHDEWLFLHKTGDYEYRNPDSVYVHRFMTFATREEALDWFYENVSRREQREWRLYLASVSRETAQQGPHEEESR